MKNKNVSAANPKRWRSGPWPGAAVALVAVALGTVHAAVTRWSPRVPPLPRPLYQAPVDYSAAEHLPIPTPGLDTPHQSRLRAIPSETVPPNVRLMIAASLDEPIDSEQILAGSKLSEAELIELEDLAQSVALMRQLPLMTPEQREIALANDSVRSREALKQIIEAGRRESVERESSRGK